MGILLEDIEQPRIGEHVMLIDNDKTVTIIIADIDNGWNAIATLRDFQGNTTNIVERDYIYKYTDHAELINDIFGLVTTGYGSIG